MGDSVDDTSRSLKRGVLDHVQILRAVAASLVVVQHAIVGVATRRGDQGIATAGPYSGGAAITAFFIVSGFIMSYQSRGSFARRRAAEYFLVRRVARIVPLYWILTLVWLWWVGVGQYHAWWKQLLLSLLFLPNILAPGQNRMQPLLAMGWTLEFEVFFYLLFALCLLLPYRRGVQALLGTLLGVTLAAWLLGRFLPVLFRDILSFYSPSLLLFFGMGVLVDLLTQWKGWRQSVRFPLSPAFLLTLAPITLLLVQPRISFFRLVGFVVALGAPIVFLCVVARSMRDTWLSRVLIAAGDASYCTYLCHGFLLHAVSSRLIWLQGSRFYYAVLAIVTVIAANLLGWTVHRLVERPMLRRLLRWLKERPRYRYVATQTVSPTYLR